MKHIISALLFLFSISVLHPTPRYVKAGNPNPVPPYLSWATAADSIQKCIKVSQPGDTIFVGAGTYKEEVHMSQGIALIGAGWDSTIIDTRDLNPQNSLGSVQMDNYCHISGFRIIVSSTTDGRGINAIKNGNYLYCTISLNLIERCGHAVYAQFGDIRLNKTIIRNANYGVKVVNADAVIEKCIIYAVTEAVFRTEVGSITKIRNNTIQIGGGNNPRGGYAGWSESNTYQNNVFYLNNNNGTGIDAWIDDTLINNVVFGKLRMGIHTYSGVDIRNNSVSGAQYGVDNASTSQPLLKYNNVLGCTVPYLDLTVDTTNISANPMFVNPDSMDFHLQKYSPLINNGDPSIADVDGTRSDIGAFGGPFGTAYFYNDLPPTAPVNLSAGIVSGKVQLKWNQNSEADFSHYVVYRDSVPDFPQDSLKIIGKPKTALFNDLLPPPFSKLFYRITAVDSQGLSSELSSTVSIISNGAEENEFPDNLSYQLYQNYPNPFNSETTLRFRVKQPGKVALQLYSINGELIQTIQNREYNAGHYEERLDFQSFGKQLASGFYLIVLTAYDSRATIAFRDFIKVIHLK